jgi:hypothetical protein
MAELTISVCDMCPAENRATETLTIQYGNRSRQLDLCDEHAAPLLDAWKRGKSPARRTRASSRPSTAGRRIKVSSLDEIAASRVG